MKNSKYQVRPVAGYEGKYSVSNTGQVFSHNYLRTGETRELSTTLNHDGYLYVILSNNGKSKNHYVHKLVLEAFVDNPHDKPCCDHIDKNRTNNIVSNLQWVTHKENNNKPGTQYKRGRAISRIKQKYKTPITKTYDKIPTELLPKCHNGVISMRTFRRCLSFEKSKHHARCNELYNQFCNV